ncbi:MAG: flagellar motor protein [Myxococcales bacterium]|nr:flagellar motor protein [Myxococcales bacterium]
MEWTAFVGLAVGLLALLGGQWLEGGAIAALAQPTAALIVLGGTIGATLLSSPSAEISRAARMLSRVFRADPIHPRELAARLVDMAALARKEGIIALEERCSSDPHPFLRLAMRHVIDGTSGSQLRDVLETDVQIRSEKALAGARVYETAGGFAPTLGILGAVLGLIHTMENLSEPGRLGAGIAVAFVATVYGVGAANLIFLPVANRLKRLVVKDRSAQEMIIEGALGIQAGLSPSALSDRMEAFFSRPLSEDLEAA